MVAIISSLHMRDGIYNEIVKSYLETVADRGLEYHEPRFELYKDGNRYMLSHVLAYYKVTGRNKTTEEYSGFPEIICEDAYHRITNKIEDDNNWVCAYDGYVNKFVYTKFNPVNLDLSDCTTDSEAIIKTMKFFNDSILEMCEDFKRLFEE